jgi:hypothetical protein
VALAAEGMSLPSWAKRFAGMVQCLDRTAKERGQPGPRVQSNVPPESFSL